MSSTSSSPSPPPTLSTSPTSTMHTASTETDTASTTPEPGPPPPVPPRSTRRHASFYPNVTSNKSKPFSRSAAKRESVMALGSIEHLQHYFTKTGLQAKQKPQKGLSQLVPALGPFALSSSPAHTHLSITPSSSDTALTALGDLPPSPAIPTPRPVRIPYVEDVKDKTDPEVLRRGVVKDLDEVESLWGLSSISSTSQPTAVSPRPVEGSLKPHLSSLGSPALVRHPSSSSVSSTTSSNSFNVLAALRSTTHLIRSVRNYVLTLPNPNGLDASPTHSTTAAILPRSFGFVYSSAGPSSSLAKSARRARERADKDPTQLIRRAALDLLAQLRLLEESTRLPGERIDDGGSEASFSGGISRARSPFDRSVTGSPAGSASGRESHRHVNVWPDSDEEMDGEEREGEQEERREAWDERLERMVLGGGFLYRGVNLEELEKEKEAVNGYLGVVDEVLFGGGAGGGGGERMWRRKDKERDRRSAVGERRASVGGNVHTAAFAGDGRRGGRRVVSAAGVLESGHSALGGGITEEPEEMEGGAGRELDALAEGEEDDEGEGEEHAAAELGHIAEEEEEEEEGDEVSDEDLPEWARRGAFVDDFPGRLHALLISHLPAHLLPSLPPSSPHPTLPPLLTALSSGQLLCTAYNTAVRRSRKPWGYISSSAIHDIVALEKEQAGGGGGGKEGKGGWTFRRTENLRLWAAALKLRYLISISTTPVPPHLVAKQVPPPSSLGGVSSSVAIPAHFDPKLVASRLEGWEDMLATAVELWVSAVVDERRRDGGT